MDNDPVQVLVDLLYLPRERAVMIADIFYMTEQAQKLEIRLVRAQNRIEEKKQDFRDYEPQVAYGRPPKSVA